MVAFCKFGRNVLKVDGALLIHLFPATPRPWRCERPLTVTFLQISQVYDIAPLCFEVSYYTIIGIVS